VLLLGVVVGSVSVTAAQAPWTSVGSAGTVDEANLAIFNTSGPQVRILGTAPLPASLVIRYNVVAVDGVLGGSGALTARFRDTGVDSRVLAVLRQVNFTTGSTTTLLALDSDDFAPSPDLQAQEVESCAIELDFGSNAYFIEVTLSKSTAAANPILQLLRIRRIPC
jgi:hypothetical protein